MISLLVVNYRSAALAVAAIESARASTSQPLQVVAVENSCDEREAAALKGFCDVLVVSAANRGYAGAINDGRRRCDGEVLLVSNPDVTYGAGAIDALVGALDARTPVAGPALYWDEAFKWILPPSDLHTAVEKLDEAAASRSNAWWQARDRRRIRQRIAFWSLTKPMFVPAISGAVMAIRSDAFDRLGGFDERFQLYFEENDFLRRVTERRMHVVYVPGARCQHLYNQSASQDAVGSAIAYLQSEAKYLAKWNGPFVARILKRLERPPIERPAQQLDGPIQTSSDEFVEVSPDSSFETSGAHFPSVSGPVEMPAAAWDAFRGSRLNLRVIDRRTARVRATYVRYKS
jgi:N-acetylglucosaminyl-diphospho-decaprenol L-rhamnosyltransferase